MPDGRERQARDAATLTLSGACRARAARAAPDAPSKRGTALAPVAATAPRNALLAKGGSA
jgi:hypothetical protein